MIYLYILFCVIYTAAAIRHYSPKQIFSNTPTLSDYHIPTIHESAIQARRVLHLESIGTLSTVFPTADGIHPQENRPSGLGGAPIGTTETRMYLDLELICSYTGLMDYYADCEPDTGNPTILAISIATSFKNVAAGSNITLSLRWHPPGDRYYSAANLPRFSLMGYLEAMSQDDVEKHNVAGCFTRYHHDARAWLPGNQIHESHFVRLVVREVYWIGGFGDRAFIGWIPVENWKNVTRTEVDNMRLPGEKKQKTKYVDAWKSWFMNDFELRQG
ncbi:MAG: hypothetical protein M1812_002465 [Candelaria pacifica]|nr:MAG: hypothetical protein M1812_002465 [Candelaria pacifica]